MYIYSGKPPNCDNFLMKITHSYISADSGLVICGNIISGLITNNETISIFDPVFNRYINVIVTKIFGSDESLNLATGLFEVPFNIRSYMVIVKKTKT